MVPRIANGKCTCSYTGETWEVSDVPTDAQFEYFGKWASLWDNGFIAADDEYDGNPFAF